MSASNSEQHPQFEQQPTIEADEAPSGDNRLDSDYSESILSEIESINSSLNEYFVKNGRRYHMYFGPDKNPMPNDTTEQERLDLNHEMLMLVCKGKIQYAPVTGNQEIRRVLDVGTGTGIWASDFATENPHCEVIGFDISPIQPAWVPPNCRFEIDDFELEWNFKHPFHYIHCRNIAQSVSDWPRLIEQAKKNLLPGGFLELGEYTFVGKSDDNTLPDDWPVDRFFSILREALARIGRMVPTRQDLFRLLQDAGFEDIHVKAFKYPVGTWPKDPALKQAGRFLNAQAESGYEAYMLHLGTGIMGMPEAEVLQLCKEAKEAQLMTAREGKHIYYKYVAAYGRKPEI